MKRGGGIVARMIYISFGMLKSASTMLYQLTEEALRAAGRRPLVLGPPLRPRFSTTNYFDQIDPALIARIQAEAAGRDVVLKTHQRPHPDVAAMIASGQIMASASIRDPREIALSMIDHGARSRRWGIAEFSECAGPADCLPSIDQQMESLAQWAAVPGVRVHGYNAICFGTARVVRDIAQQAGLQIDAAAIAARFAGGRGVGQFSKGQAERWREMDEATSSAFLARYADFHRDYGWQLHAGLPANGASNHRTAKGQLRQVAVDLYRLAQIRLR